MREIRSTDLIIDEEFCRLEPPIKNSSRTESRSAVEGSVQPEKIYVWGNIILKGFSGYELCVKQGIPFHTVQIHFEDRQEAISWACMENLKKDGLTNEMRIYLIGKRYLAEKSRESDPLSGRSAGAVIGKTYGIAQSTVCKYAVYAQAIDKIALTAPEVVDAVLSGTLLISQNTVIEASRFSKNDLAAVNDTPLNFFSFIQSQKRKRGRPPLSVRKAFDDLHTPARIKQMPTYDPDSCIAGLTLTIPSWISSIGRARDTADFSAVSDDAVIGLSFQLNKLIDASYELLNILQEESQ